MLGVVHCDLHPGNIIYDPEKGRVTVIDFGFAVKLPDSLINSLRRTASVLDEPELVWHARALDRYASTVTRMRGAYAWLNSDGLLLKALHERLADVGGVPAARLAVWRRDMAGERLRKLRNARLPVIAIK